MKTSFKFFVILGIGISCILSSCAFQDPGGEKTCQGGICIEITVMEPITLNQPAKVKTKISSTIDKLGFKVRLVASPSNVIFGQNELWTYDAVANQSQEFESSITFTSQGGYLVSAEVFFDNSPYVLNQDYVVIDKNGTASVNPTPGHQPTAMSFPTWDSTAMARPGPTLPPKPRTSGFSPSEWLQKCGWTVSQPETLSAWAPLSIGFNISETAIIDTQVNAEFTIGFKDLAAPDTIVQAKIGLCRAGQGWTTGGAYEWNSEMHSGVLFKASVSLQFSEPGDVPIFIVILDTQRNRIAGDGRLIYIKPKN